MAIATGGEFLHAEESGLMFKAFVDYSDGGFKVLDILKYGLSPVSLERVDRKGEARHVLVRSTDKRLTTNPSNPPLVVPALNRSYYSFKSFAIDDLPMLKYGRWIYRDACIVKMAPKKYFER
jgi:hypothetical protein